MHTESTSLYIRDNKDTIRVWSIWVEGQVIHIEHGVLNGAMQLKTEYIEKGKGGRSIEEQIMMRVSSRISRQRDKGYSPNYTDAHKKPTNLLGLVKPMLAHKLSTVKNIDFNEAFVQRKYDGNRMLVANVNGEVIAYSRNGKQVVKDSISHIIEFMNIPENTIIDGEIYAHGESLQTICSWVKRAQEDSMKLRYHVYDMVSQAKFSERLRMLKDISFGVNAHLVQTTRVDSMEAVMAHFRESRKEGYEGEIIRWGTNGYEDGKRSRSLVKVKEWLDDEFKVINILPSADGWARLECVMPNGNVFWVSAPGDMSEKLLPILSPLEYLGRYVNVEYANLTRDGIPFHPIATYWVSLS